MRKIAILMGTRLGAQMTRDVLDTHGDKIAFIETETTDSIRFPNGPVGRVAAQHDVLMFHHTSEDQTLERIEAHDITTVILLWWPKIVHKINKLGINVINTHPSYLPYNQGKHPYYWSIVDGTPFGVTIHRVDDGVDTGDILWQRRVELTPMDTGQTAHFKSNNAMRQLLQDYIQDIVNENFPIGIPQEDSIATYHHSDEFELPIIKPGELYDSHTFINDCRGRTFENSRSGRRIEIDGKIYRIHMNLIKEDDESLS